MPTESPRGLDLDAFGTWLADALPGAIHGELSAELISGGRSNLTYGVTDETSSWIVRRPPLGHVQATAHDMGREFTVMSALVGTEVPVPRVYAHCTDASVIGAPFYVMERIDGEAYRSAEQLAPFTADDVDAVAAEMVRVLARLHAVRPAEVGLAEFGRPQGFLARQLRRWSQQLTGSATRPLPDAETLFARLSERIPADDAERDLAAASIVHGDYRLDNLLTRPGESEPVKAVVDWEMSTIGDPLTDVALLVLYDRLGEIAPPGGTVADVSRAPGYPSTDTQLERYAVASGREPGELGDLGFHLGLAYYKFATILEGIHHRHLAGQTVGEGFDSIGGYVEPLFAAGLDALGAPT